MKLSMKFVKEMEVFQPQETLQYYLDKATHEQEVVYANWIKVPAKKALFQKSRGKSQGNEHYRHENERRLAKFS